jgi:hypothetical protein
MRPFTANSPIFGLSLLRCKQALHVLRLLQQLSEQAGAAAVTDNGNIPILLSQPQCGRQQLAPESALPPQASQQSATTEAEAEMTQDLQALALIPPPEEQDDPASTPENAVTVTTEMAQV